jgi:hypothetical protein
LQLGSSPRLFLQQGRNARCHLCSLNHSNKTSANRRSAFLDSR